MILLKRNIFTLVEFGSSKILCVIFQILANNIKIVGFGSEISCGIKNGVVSDMQAAVKSVGKAVSKAEAQYGKIIENIFVIISGCEIESEIINQEASVNNREITEKDLKNLIARAANKSHYGDSRIIVHSINNGYAIDDLYVENPVGLHAEKISASTNLISINKAKLININQVFSHCKLVISGYIVAPYADHFSCLTEDDKNIGATVINFGSENTSVLTFKNGSMTSCYTRPFGGNHITFDIAYAFGISLANAEKLKILHGTLFIDEDDESSIVANIENHNSGEVSISYNEFLSVIVARQEEILESIFLPLKLQNSKFSYEISSRKIVITGGSSKISGLVQMIGDFFPCKLIKNAEFFGLQNIDSNVIDFNKNDQSFATIIGAMKYIYNKFSSENDNGSFIENEKKFSFKRLFSFAVKN